MNREPSIDKRQRPPCFGRGFSIAHTECSSCASRRGCVRKLSKKYTGLTILHKPYRIDYVSKDAVKADVRATAAFRKRGVDPVVWRMLKLDGAFATIFGLRVKWTKCGEYCICGYDASGRLVVGFSRIDSRRVVLDFRRACAKAAHEQRAERVVNKEGYRVWRLTLNPKQLASEWVRIRHVLLRSWLRRKYRRSTSTSA